MGDDDDSLVRIYRFDPKGDQAPRYDTFRITYDPNRTVLDVLRHIYEELDGSLACRFACKIGFCVSCMLLVNGKPCFSCLTMAKREMTIEPHPKFPLIRDLVTDLNPRGSVEEGE